MIVDNASMQAVAKPQQFDVLVTPNLYGSILSNIGAALIGGPGLVPGANFGREYAVFEPGCRHVGLDIKGKNSANPTAMILSSAMMLRHLGLNDHADKISKATTMSLLKVMSELLILVVLLLLLNSLKPSSINWIKRCDEIHYQPERCQERGRTYIKYLYKLDFCCYNKMNYIMFIIVVFSVFELSESICK